MCDECSWWDVLIEGRMLGSTLWLILLNNLLSKVTQVFQFLPHTSMSTQSEGKSLTNLKQFPDLLFFTCRSVPSKVWRPCEVGQPLCAPIRNSVQHTFERDLPCHSSKLWFLLSFDNCICANQIREQFLLLHHNSVIDLCCSQSTSNMYLIMWWCRASKSTFFCNFAHVIRSTSLDNPLRKMKRFLLRLSFWLACMRSRNHLLLQKQPSNLEVTSQTFAAVKCDAGAPCSACTASFPESSFTTSPLNTTRSLYLMELFLNSEFLRWHKSINVAEWTVMPSDFALRTTSALLVTLDSSEAGSFCKFVHSSSTAACLRKVHYCRYGNRFLNHVVVRHGNWTSVRDVVLVSLFLTLCT